jgi:hypothetical protein
VHIPVYELLRLALLFEHGGVSVRLPNILAMERLDWVKDLMRGSTKNPSALSCQLTAPSVVMLHRDTSRGQ